MSLRSDRSWQNSFPSKFTISCHALKFLSSIKRAIAALSRSSLLGWYPLLCLARHQLPTQVSFSLLLFQTPLNIFSTAVDPPSMKREGMALQKKREQVTAYIQTTRRVGTPATLRRLRNVAFSLAANSRVLVQCSMSGIAQHTVRCVMGSILPCAAPKIRAPRPFFCTAALRTRLAFPRTGRACRRSAKHSALTSRFS